MEAKKKPFFKHPDKSDPYFEKVIWCKKYETWKRCAVDNESDLWWDYEVGFWTVAPYLSLPDMKPEPESQKSVPVMMKIPCMEEGGSVFRLEKVIARVDDLEREKNAEILALNTKIAELEERMEQMDIIEELEERMDIIEERMEQMDIIEERIARMDVTMQTRIARMDVTMQTRWTATSSFTTQMLANFVDVKEKVQVTAKGLLGLCDSYKILYGDNEELNKKYQALTTILGGEEGAIIVQGEGVGELL